MLLELTQMDERETHFRKVFLFYFYLGFYMPEGFVRLRGQVNHEHRVQHTFKNTQDKRKHYQEHTRQQQAIAEITRGTSSINDAYQRAIFGVSPIHPRVMVGHSY
jgi:hypothetical protein